MTKSAIVFTQQNEGSAAGKELGEKIIEKLIDKTPNVVIVFASSVYDYTALLHSIKETCTPGILVGSSSAGEFTSDDFGTDSACAIALYSTELQFRAGIGETITTSRDKVANELLNVLSPVQEYQYQYYSAMLFADALSGFTDELIELLTEKTMGKYQFLVAARATTQIFRRPMFFMTRLPTPMLQLY
ncbi:FIST N-terminal domain-containing protein [Mucilaginibacter antarcticus]|uniref:FIST N-terminal domain-containing protein n=1 Tax=Mucilaginibacter antarcticus TaxID=1855725 RepID=UPI0036300775